MFNMHPLIKQIILQIVNVNCNKSGKKSRESNEHFLDIFIEFLKNYTKWKCLDSHISAKYKSDNYRKKFIYWVKSNVFRDAFDVISSINKQNIIKYQIINSFIDGTNIRNINGSYKNNTDKNGKSLLGRLYCDKFKRGLKVTVLITSDNKPLNVIVSNGGDHDITVIPEVYKHITKTMKSNKKHRINIVGDKGYTSNKYKQQFANKGIHYIVPKKRNTKIFDKYKWYNNDLLDGRHIVENYFAHLKQFTRLRFMYEKYVYIYTGFLMLGILCMNKQID